MEIAVPVDSMPSSDMIEDLFTQLSTFLTTEWTRKRSPNNFLDSMNQSGDSTTTSQIFLDAGFQAWVAYFVVKPGSANADGQSARRRLFDSLDARSVQERAGLASRVNAVAAHPTVAKLIQSMQQQVTQKSVVGAVSVKRRREYPA
jgi:hypothetical protein